MLHSLRVSPVRPFYGRAHGHLISLVWQFNALSLVHGYDARMSLKSANELMYICYSCVSHGLDRHVHNIEDTDGSRAQRSPGSIYMV